MKLEQHEWRVVTERARTFSVALAKNTSECPIELDTPSPRSDPDGALLESELTEKVATGVAASEDAAPEGDPAAATFEEEDPWANEEDPWRGEPM